MRIWAKVIRAQRIADDLVREFGARPSDAEGWNAVLTELCKPLDLSRPVLLQKHVRDLAQFGRVVFRPADFMESVSFDRFELEIFSEKKHNE